MDIRICLLLAAEAGLALVLLWRTGVLPKPAHVLCAALLLTAAFVLRGACLNYVTDDYRNFLSVWVDFFRTHGGLAALRAPVGNYKTDIQLELPDGGVNTIFPADVNKIGVFRITPQVTK